jgi:hypothetical protein
MKALFTLSSNVIPVMDYERQFMAISGTTLDQARFALSFIGALLSGFLIRFIPTARGEHRHIQWWLVSSSGTPCSHNSNKQLQDPCASSPDSRCMIITRPCHSQPHANMLALSALLLLQGATSSAQWWASCWCTIRLAATWFTGWSHHL